HAIAQVVRNTKANLILVRDLPLAFPAAILGKAYRIPVILDNAENYPAMLEDRLRFTPTGSLARVIRHPLPARLIERITIRLVDHIIVVVEESRDRMIRAGVHPGRISVVSNTPKVDQWEWRGLSGTPTRIDERINLVYLGNLDGSRGLDTAIWAVRKLKDRGYVVQLSIVGEGPYINQLRKLASQLDLTGSVTIMGRLPFRHVQSVMAQSHIGLIPHYSTDAWNSTMPNKLFDYMMWGLPIIVSDVKPVARIVREEGCGEVFRDRDSGDLVRCIMALQDPKTRIMKGTKGQAAILRRYNWSHDAKV